MNRRSLHIVVGAIAALFIAVMLLGATTQAQGGPLFRHAADFKNFDFTESATDLPVPGILVFKKPVFVPFGHNVLYVTISTTADTHDGAALLLKCVVDGAACNPGGGGAGGAPAGWINLNKHKNIPGFFGDGGGGGGDNHDNALHYTWCIPLKRGGPHVVGIRMAAKWPDESSVGFAGFPNHFVFFEAAHFYIDSNRIFGSNRCRRAPGVDPSDPFGAGEGGPPTDGID